MYMKKNWGKVFSRANMLCEGIKSKLISFYPDHHMLEGDLLVGNRSILVSGLVFYNKIWLCNLCSIYRKLVVQVDGAEMYQQ